MRTKDTNLSTIFKGMPLVRYVAVFIAGVVFASVLVVSAANNVVGPAASPTTVTGLESPVSVTGLVSISKLDQQKMQGPLRAGSNGTFPAELATTTQDLSSRVGAMGSAGVAQPYVPTFPVAGNFGVFGYATGGSSNYGIYSVSTNGVAIGGKVSKATDLAGIFYGPMDIASSGSIPGNLDIQGTLKIEPTGSKPGGIVSNDPTGISVHYDVTTAGTKTGIVGSSTGNTSIIGHSNLNYGMSVRIWDAPYAAYGESTNNHGVYGVNVGGGPGVVGQGDTGQADGETHIAQGVYGESKDIGVKGYSLFTLPTGLELQVAPYIGSTGRTTTTDSSIKNSGVGIYACGTNTAGDFAGDVYVRGALQMGIGLDTYITQSGVYKGRAIDPQVTMTDKMLQDIGAMTSVTLNTISVPVIP